MGTERRGGGAKPVFRVAHDGSAYMYPARRKPKTKRARQLQRPPQTTKWKSNANGQLLKFILLRKLHGKLTRVNPFFITKSSRTAAHHAFPQDAAPRSERDLQLYG